MLSGGVATLSIVPHTAGTHSISVVYPSDANYLAATSSTVNETVTAGAAASIAVNSGSAQSKTIGSAFVTALSLTVTDTYGNPVGGATVTFSAPASGASASLSSATATANSSGIASVTATANGVAGAYSVTAASGGASASFSLTNLKAQPPLTLTASASSVSAGTSITLTATTSGVGGTTPAGSVTFYDGTASLGTGMLSGGVATLSIVPHTAGTHLISVVYPSDANYLAATSSTVNELITAATAASIAVNSGSAQSQTVDRAFGSALSVTVTDAYGNPVNGATVAYNAPASGASSSLSSATATTNASGVASVTATANNLAGVYAIAASIHGGASANFSLTNLPASPTVALTTSATPVFILSSVTYTATVTGLNGFTPTGTVTFYDGTASLGTATLASSGVATLSSAPQTVGTHPITVSYSGDPSYSAATGNTVSEVAQDFTLAVASNAASSITILPGSTATFSLVVTPVNGATFPAPITLTVVGGPSAAPPVLGTNLVASGAGTTNLTLTVAVPGEPIASARERRGGLGRTALALLGLPLLALGGLGRRLRRGLPRGLAALSIAFGALTALGGLSGCGFASGYFGQAPATYTYTVTGTAGPLNHSTSVTLTIQ
jgi:protocatechuate 3,4-dioxygenase beta subunit